MQGHLDVPLNEQGVAQAVVTGRWFAQQKVQFAEAWSSDLSRARVVRAGTASEAVATKLGFMMEDGRADASLAQTAERILAAQADAVDLKTDERIRERFLGTMQVRAR